MDEIRKILLLGQFDFNEAFRLFCTYSRSESLVRYIARKQCAKTLKYQLERILQQNPKPNPHIAMFAQYMGVATPSTAPIPDTGKDGDKEKASGLIDFRRHERYDRNKLPEHLQQIYDKNSQAYKESRSLHEKMKLVKTDPERKECRNTLVALATEIRERWELLDSELGKESGEGKGSSDDGWKESTCRAYISKKLKKEELSDKDIIDLRERVKQLQDRNLLITDTTQAKLKELKVI